MPVMIKCLLLFKLNEKELISGARLLQAFAGLTVRGLEIKWVLQNY